MPSLGGRRMVGRGGPRRPSPSPESWTGRHDVVVQAGGSTISNSRAGQGPALPSRTCKWTCRRGGEGAPDDGDVGVEKMQYHVKYADRRTGWAGRYGGTLVVTTEAPCYAPMYILCYVSSSSSWCLCTTRHDTIRHEVQEHVKTKKERDRDTNVGSCLGCFGHDPPRRIHGTCARGYSLHREVREKHMHSRRAHGRARATAYERRRGDLTLRLACKIAW